MAAHRKSDRRRDDLCAGGLRNRAMEYASIWFAIRKPRASSASAFCILRGGPTSA